MAGSLPAGTGPAGLMVWRALQGEMAAAGYIAADHLAMALHLARTLGRPLLLEGAAGVGKTEVAKVLAGLQGTRLIRLQCYEGLDAAQSLYEWNYQRQLLAIRAAEGAGETGAGIEARIFSDAYLLRRPLLEAISQPVAPVLLIDEIDRADEAFEAFLLEILAEFQVTVPELGTIRAVTRPQVILTANGTRDLSDALRRRCLYSYMDYPDAATEARILAARGPGLGSRLAAQIIGFVQALRREELEKKPGIAEMLDWAAALAGLGVNDLSDDPVTLQATLVCLLKTERDQGQVTRELTQRLAGKAA